MNPQAYYNNIIMNLLQILLKLENYYYQYLIKLSSWPGYLCKPIPCFLLDSTLNHR